VKQIEKKMDDVLALRLENKRAIQKKTPYSCFYQKKKMKKKEFSSSLQVVFSIVDRSQFEI
jgi:hypothetical protein